MQLSPGAHAAAELHWQTFEQVWVSGHIMLWLQSQRPELTLPDVTATQTRLFAQASPHHTLRLKNDERGLTKTISVEIRAGKTTLLREKL